MKHQEILEELTGTVKEVAPTAMPVKSLPSNSIHGSCALLISSHPPANGIEYNINAVFLPKNSIAQPPNNAPPIAPIPSND